MKRLIVVSLLLAGCSSPYKPDLEGKPVATVRIASVHPADSRAGVLAGSCVPFVSSDWARNTQAITVFKDGNSIYQKVPAGQPFTLSFFTSSTVVEGDLATDAVCAVAIRFTPDAGVDYEAVFAGDAENCRLELGRMRPRTGEGSRTEPVTGAVELPGC